MLTDSLYDLRHASRVLLKNSGVTLIAVLMLAFGIGANTAVFSVINAVLLKPLPVSKPDELVSLYTSDFSGPRYGASSYLDYLDIRNRADLLNGLLAYWRQSVRIKNDDQAEDIIAAEIVTGNYFDVVGVRPMAGRTFLPDEDRVVGTDPVAVISYRCWQRRFGGAPTTIGKTILLNNITFTIIGIVPPEFSGLVRGSRSDVWIPIMMTPQIAPGEDSLNNRGTRFLTVLGRLKPGVTLKNAQAQLSVIADQQFATYGQQWADSTAAGRAITVLPESQSRLPPGAFDKALGIAGLITVVMLLVLFVACANIAGLFLARAIARQKEMAVRLALGASKLRLIRQLLSESLLIALLAAIAGAILAWQSLELVAGLIPPMSIDLSPDIRVFGFTVVVSLATTIAVGLAPALEATKVDLMSAIKDESSLRGFRRSHMRSGLVVAQVAVSVLLLSVSGLFLRSLMKASSIDPGFNSDNLVLTAVLLNDYKEGKGTVLFQQMLERLGSLPDVRDVSLVNRAGLDFDGARCNLNIEGYARQRGEDMEVAFNLVGPRYFQTMQMPLLRGRDFTEQDVKGAPGVVIVNETFAKRYFPNQDALGKRLSISGSQGPFLEIIGIARDGKYWSLFEETQPFFSLPLLQNYQGYAVLLMRHEGDNRKLIDAIRPTILALDHDLSIVEITTMRDHIGLGMLPLRIASIASLVFGGLALLLSGLGIYGLISYFAGQRTREIGVRLALGAEGKDIVKLVLGQGFSIVVIGITLGLACAFAATRVLGSFLVGVGPTDFLTFGGVAVSLAVVALLACWIPARRAAKVDPLVSLRYE